jgi:nucleotide-binding universal stress UspA family protein
VRRVTIEREVDIVSGEADPVVVGVDGSTRSIGALRWAADEAARRRRCLRIVHAVGSADPQLNEPAQSLVDDAVARAVAWRPRLVVTGVVKHGGPTAELVAESERAELLVLASRGRGTVASLLLGSVSAQVAAHAHCPVLVVHHGQAWAGFEGPPRSGRPVVVGVDGSEASDLAVGLAFEEAAALGVSLVAVHAWRPPHPPGHNGVRPDVHDVAVRPDVHDVAVRPDVHGVAETTRGERQLLAESVAAWQAKYPRVPVRQRLEPDSAGAALVKASEEAQLAVVGSRGYGGFAGLLLGSASQQLLHHAQCPVLVVRRREAPPTPE